MILDVRDADDYAQCKLTEGAAAELAQPLMLMNVTYTLAITTKPLHGGPPPTAVNYPSSMLSQDRITPLLFSYVGSLHQHTRLRVPGLHSCMMCVHTLHTTEEQEGPHDHCVRQ